MGKDWKPCQDSGAYAPFAYRQGRPDGYAWCGCCGHLVKTVVDLDDDNRIPHYADHSMQGKEYKVSA